MGSRVQGKVALVTGAAMGLGAEAARRLAREGAAVLLTDVADEAADAVVRDIRAAGGRAAFVHHDVMSEADWDTVVVRAKAEFGALHILVNNAGVSGTRPPSSAIRSTNGGGSCRSTSTACSWGCGRRAS
jgi:NAD(P)-dependent dehydrogenase (short-subunit alcohol dehydrogenase family)